MKYNLKKKIFELSAMLRLEPFRNF